jgi:hypothetical protein
MTWPQAKLKAEEVTKNLRSEFPPEAVRLILRALSRQYQKEKTHEPDYPNGQNKGE